eukprot:g9749.t1
MLPAALQACLLLRARSAGDFIDGEEDQEDQKMPVLALLQAALYYDVKQFPVLWPGSLSTPDALSKILRKLLRLCPEHSYEKDFFLCLLETAFPKVAKTVDNCCFFTGSCSSYTGDDHLDLLKRIQLSLLHSTPEPRGAPGGVVSDAELARAIDAHERGLVG